MGHGGGERREVRTGFLASAAGILVSFLVLATGVAGLRLAGESVGWGVQFQQPVFLVFMAIVVTLFSANLFGLFEIRLPGTVSDMAVEAGGHGKKGVAGHFLTGAFATLLATPCTAPFLGTAVSFALLRGSAEIYAVFLCLGIGLALPYLAGAAFPDIATRMPRPGPWMVTLRRGLGILLLGTAVWLVTVLAVQLGTRSAVAVAAALAVLLVGLVFARPGAQRSPRLGRGLAGVAGAAALALAIWPGSGPGNATAAAAHWKPFDREAIRSAVASGAVVFVDVTADWCITCQVNKALVLKNETVRGRLAGDGGGGDGRRLDPSERRDRGLPQVFRPVRHTVQRGLRAGAAERRAAARAPDRDGGAGSDGPGRRQVSPDRRTLSPKRASVRGDKQASIAYVTPDRHTSEGHDMTIQVGDKIPSATLTAMGADGPGPVATDELFSGKKVVLFAVPGAFTPTCSAKHLPGFVEQADAIKAKGVDTIACVAVNDVFVMDAWGKSQSVGDKVRMLADGSADFARALDVELDLVGRGLGVRSRRYSMIVDDGTVTQLNLEEGGGFEVSDAGTILSQL